MAELFEKKCFLTSNKIFWAIRSFVSPNFVEWLKQMGQRGAKSGKRRENRKRNENVEKNLKNQKAKNGCQIDKNWKNKETNWKQKKMSERISFSAALHAPETIQEIKALLGQIYDIFLLCSFLFVGNVL